MRRSVLLLLSLAGCAPREAPPAAAAGSPRIVSLAPNITEIVCAVGAASNLAGRTSACDYPPEVVGRVPVIGGFGEPALDLLLAARPSLILDVDLADESSARTLRELGIRRERIACGRLDEIVPAIRRVGALAGRPEAGAALAGRIGARLAAFRREAGATGGPRPTVYAEIWNDPCMTAGRHSFVSDMIALAGGTNIGDAVASAYFPVSSEWVVARDPEVIFCFYMTPSGKLAEQVARRNGWANVRAVRAGRVFGDFDNNVILRPGPRVVEGIETLRARLGR